MTNCRICESSDLKFRFALRGFRGHEMSYYACSSCGSLMCDNPTWLDQAYADHSDDNDPGAHARARSITRALSALAGSGLPDTRVLDYGSGQGILTKHLRSERRDVTTFDPYRGHDVVPAGMFDVVLMIEVVEHLTCPRDVFARLGRTLTEHGWIFLSTNIYTGQDETWLYLVPQFGQHITFPSASGLDVLALRAGLTRRLSLVDDMLSLLEIHLLFDGSMDPRPLLAGNGFTEI